MTAKHAADGRHVAPGDDAIASDAEADLTPSPIDGPDSDADARSGGNVADADARSVGGVAVSDARSGESVAVSDARSGESIADADSGVGSEPGAVPTGVASDAETAAEAIGTARWSADGLIPAVIQDDGDGAVLMVGYMDAEAMRRTLTEGRVTFWSRSRQEYWRKGDTSGHAQYVRSAALDCDADALLVRVHQIGPACHTGARSCFDVHPLEPAIGAVPATGAVPAIGTVTASGDATSGGEAS